MWGHKRFVGHRALNPRLLCEDLERAVAELEGEGRKTPTEWLRPGFPAAARVGPGRSLQLPRAPHAQRHLHSVQDTRGSEREATSLPHWPVSSRAVWTRFLG